jgi:photosystem II stability/assembly factor-like uncharacterized protein
MRRTLAAHAIATTLVFATAAAAAAVEVKTATFGGLAARPIGPAVMGGRVADLAVAPGDPAVMWVGTASGGVWRSDDGGITFTPVFDQQPVQSIGALAIDPKDSKTVWVGTGESWVRNSVSVGNGVYRTTDGGDSWQHLGLPDSERISRIAVDPSDSKTVWVCATGHLWNANEERGLFKSTDAGKTWNKVLYVDADTGCADFTLDPQDPQIAYAAMWQFRRQPWTFSSGGKGSGLHRTTDGGKTWQRLSDGLPQGPLGRIAVAVAPSRPNVVYAVVEAKEKTALYRSQDLGLHWEELNSSFNVSIRPFYFARLVVDPVDWSRVYKPGLTLSVSRDGGKSFTSPFSGGFGGSVHSDHHALWIDPKNPQHLVLGTDGGVYESLDRGGKWRHLNNIPVSQIYQVSYDMEHPYNVYVGLQDNGSWTGPSQAPGGVRNRHWDNIGYGDGFWAFPDPTEPGVVYSEMQGGGLFRVGRQTGEIQEIKPFATAGEEDLRFNWNTPFFAGSSGALYAGSQYVHRSRDRGASWERISPDLTTDDPAKQKQMESGGLTVDNSTAENHTTIVALAESPKNPEVLWAGTDDGNLQLTRDGGKSWTNVVGNVPDVPKNTWVSFVEASPHDEATAFATFDGHRTGDMTPWVFVTRDHGASWTRLAASGVDGHAFVVRQDLVRPGLLYLGTEMGLWISLDEGASWARFDGGLPRVAVHDLEIHPRDGDLIVATHGRGVWILDDLSPLRGLTPEVLEADFALLPSAPGVMAMGGTLQDFPSDAEYFGPNPSEAVSIVYYLKKRHVLGDLKVEVFDADGKLVSTLPGSMRLGINQVPWLMRLPAPKVPPGNALVPAFIGPRMPEGTYRYVVTRGDEKVEGTVALVADPRSPHSAEDRALQQRTALALYAHLEDLSYVADTLVDLRDQARARATALGGRDGLAKKLTAWSDELEGLRKKMVATHPAGFLSGEEQLREQLAALYGGVMGYEGRPTDSQIGRIEALSVDLKARQADFAALTGEARVAALNRELSGRKQEPIVVLSREEWVKKREGGSGTAGLASWPELPVGVRF